MSAEPGVRRRRGGRRALRVLGTVIRAVCAIFALILVVHVLFIIGGANPGNWLAAAVDGSANSLTLGLANLFTPANPDYRTIAHYGVPALVWLVIGSVVGRVLGRS